MKTNRHSDSHLKAVEIELCRQWAFNVYKHYMAYKNGKEVEKRLAERSLYRLFFWELVLYMNQLVDVGLLQELEKFRGIIDDKMKKPVVKMLKGSVAVIFLCTECTWGVKEIDNSTEVSTRVLTRTWEFFQFAMTGQETQSERTVGNSIRQNL